LTSEEYLMRNHSSIGVSLLASRLHRARHRRSKFVGLYLVTITCETTKRRNGSRWDFDEEWTTTSHN
jgi:hypothetical protein